MRRHWSPLETMLVAAQALWLALSLVVVVIIDAQARGLTVDWSSRMLPVLAAAGCILLGFYYGGLLDLTHLQRRAAAAGPAQLLVPSVAMATVWLASIRLCGVGGHSSAAHLLGGVLFAAWVQTHGVRILRRRRLTHRIAIVGYGADARQLASDLLCYDPRGSELVAFIVAADSVPATPEHADTGHPILALPTIMPFVSAANVSHILVLGAEFGAELPVHELLLCRERGIVVESAGEFRERLLGRVSAGDLDPNWIVPILTKHTLKRCVDVVAAVAILIAGAPLCLLVAVAIKLEDGGPIFFHQLRMGEAGTRFWLHKLRSMRPDAEAESGPLWAVPNDPRSTRVGRWIRVLRIDELPQAWNILVGEMSLVGPRPERPEFEDTLRAAIPRYDFRHALRPGLTGWAQINLPTAATLEHARLKFEYDLYYIRHTSGLMDLLILLRSGQIILREWEAALVHGFDLEAAA